VFVSPLYLVNQLYAEHRGNQLLSTTVDSPTFDSSRKGTGVPYLDAVSSRAADGKRIFIKAVNTSWTSALLTTITIQGSIPTARAEIKTITAPSVVIFNDFSHPDAVTI